jgi:hypothetical protein
VHLGEPVDTALDVGRAAHEKREIKAREILGASALDPHAQLGARVLTVQTLLSPIAREHVGIVRCLGLNYADHAVRRVFLFACAYGR